MERIIKRSLMEFLSSRKLFLEAKYGFLQQRSCISCQFDFLDYVTSAIDTGNSIVILYLDLQKAFNTVPHSLLLSKLEAYGVINPLLSWFSSYLYHRTQSVCIRNSSSNNIDAASGVIQGSVLGPMLFLIYINDIF